MSQINNIASTDAAQQIVNNPRQRPAPSASDASGPQRAPDQVDLSGVEQYVQALKTNNIRTDLVANVRTQIDNGTYETDDKLNGSIDGLLDDLNK